MFSELRAWLRPWYNMYAVMTISAAVGLGGYQWVQWKELSPSDWGTWIGSIGTVRALIGTIWLATAESRLRDREAQALAILAASAILLKTARVTGAIEGVKKGLESEFPIGKEKLIYKIFFDTLSGTERWKIEDLVPLCPLSNHVAGKLAFVNQILVTVEMALKAASEEKSFLTDDFRGDMVRQLRIASAALASSVAECKCLTNKLVIDTDD